MSSSGRPSQYITVDGHLTFDTRLTTILASAYCNPDAELNLQESFRAMDGVTQSTLSEAASSQFRFLALFAALEQIRGHLPRIAATTPIEFPTIEDILNPDN